MVAAGASLAPEETEGLTGPGWMERVFTFYSPEGAAALADAFAAFNGGRLVVAVLDTRLAEASYRGRIFPQLPPMRRTRDRAEVLDVLGALRAAAEEGT